jgi:hypothetical protein
MSCAPFSIISGNGGPSSIANDAHGLEMLLPKTQISENFVLKLNLGLTAPKGATPVN